MNKTSLVITFLTASGGKKSMKFQDAQTSPDPIKVKALASFIVTNNPFATNDPLVAVEKAHVERVQTSDIDLE